MQAANGTRPIWKVKQAWLVLVLHVRIQHVPQGRAKSIGCIRLMDQTNKQREEKEKKSHFQRGRKVDFQLPHIATWEASNILDGNGV